MLLPFKLFFKLIAGLIAVVVLYVTFSFVQVWQASGHEEARPADAIIVFGAAQYNGRPSPVLAARLDHAVDLYKAKIADRVVVTGGGAPGDTTTEASASARYLMDRGVPDSAILREVQGRSSWQSLASAAHFLRQQGRVNVVLVSDPFHSARIKAMARELGLTAHVSPTRTSPIGGVEEVTRMARESVAVGAGRIVGFRRLMGIQRVRDEVQKR